MTKVSVIVPVYNNKKYLDKCFDSLVNQTYKDIEIIIINDGSTDGSEKIICKYTSIYTQIKYYKKKNEGVSIARNYGLKKATGEYIMYVDSDDYVSYDIVEKMIIYAIENNLDIVTSDIVKFYESGKKEYYKTNKEYTNNEVKNYIIGDSGPCAKLFKSEIIKKNPFRKIAYEDLDIIPTLVLYTKKIGYINEAMYYYRQVDGSATRLKEFKKSILDIYNVLENINQKLYNEYQDEVEYLYIAHLLRTTTLRLLKFNNTEIYLDQVANMMHNKFPKWNKNKYYQKSSIKMKIICHLAYHKKIRILKMINRITKK